MYASGRRGGSVASLGWAIADWHRAPHADTLPAALGLTFPLNLPQATGEGDSRDLPS